MEYQIQNLATSYCLVSRPEYRKIFQESDNKNLIKTPETTIFDEIRAKYCKVIHDHIQNFF